MENPFDINGLVFWNAEEIKLRDTAKRFFETRMADALRALNPQWFMVEIEGPLLNPHDLLNPNYTADDIWIQHLNSATGAEMSEAKMLGQPRPRLLALRPETTPSSYAYAQMLLNNHSGTKPPFVVWQAGKSFRREIVQPTKHMRLKEFYQQEFQCIFSADTANDYHTAILEPVRKMLSDFIMLPTKLIPSDRLPSYSKVTMDVEVYNGDKWMEVCSISLRTDFPEKLKFQGKNSLVEKDAYVLEVAIGLDRVVYNWQQARRDDLDFTPPMED